MANAYILMNDDALGKTALNQSVIASIAQISADDVDNVVIAQDRFSKGVEVKIVKDKLNVVVDVALKNGAKAEMRCEELQTRIYENIYQMTGIKCNHITVNVVAFDFE
ncbi:MAG: Asp23/Gls24 family envelope stress response protein [Erysipelotrichaceae bacterium]|nr:Asp23/Gls24 family envelope stress response protein [Erysipelotrichaceae bacterium]